MYMHDCTTCTASCASKTRGPLHRTPDTLLPLLNHLISPNTQLLDMASRHHRLYRALCVLHPRLRPPFRQLSLKLNYARTTGI